MKKREIREILAGIQDKDGRLTPRMVVDAASDPDHPLHDRFEWDDEVAGLRFREHQARRLIEEVVYVSRHVGKILESVGYVRDPEVDPKEQGYRSVEVIATEDELARDVLIREFKRIGSSLARAKELAAVFDMDAEMADFERRVVRMQTHLQLNTQA